MKRIELLPVLMILLGMISCNKEPAFYVAKTSFTIRNPPAYVDSFVQFTNTSDANRVSYVWNFGDGTTSDLKNPTHAYANRGQYTVTLKTYVNKTFSNSVTQNLSVLIGKKLFSLKNNTVGFDFAEGLDSSIVVIGYTWNNGLDDQQIFFSKFDKNLRMSSIKYLDKNTNQYSISNLERISDGNFLMSDWNPGSAIENHFALSKFDQQGNVIWENTYTETFGQCLFATEAKDGGIISIGYEDTEYYPTVTVLKTDREGHFEWKRNFEKENLQLAKKIIPLDDGYLFASSTSGPIISNYNDTLVITKLDLNGEVIWKKATGWIVYGSETFTIFNSSLAINDKCIVVINEGCKDVMVFDLSGNFIKRSFSESDRNLTITSSANNKFVIGGLNTSYFLMFANFFSNTGDDNGMLSLAKQNNICQPTMGDGTAIKPLFGGDLLFMGIQYNDCLKTDMGSLLFVRINENGDIQ